MEVYPAARKGGTGTEGRGERKEQSGGGGQACWLAGRQGNLQLNQELCGID